MSVNVQHIWRRTSEPAGNLRFSGFGARASGFMLQCKIEMLTILLKLAFYIRQMLLKAALLTTANVHRYMYIFISTL